MIICVWTDVSPKSRSDILIILLFAMLLMHRNKPLPCSPFGSYFVIIKYTQNNTFRTMDMNSLQVCTNIIKTKLYFNYSVSGLMSIKVRYGF